MCSPTAVLIGTQVVSSVAGAYTQIKQGEYARDVGKYNARVAENAAEEARRKGTEEEMTHREKVMQLLSRQRAALGAANVDIGSGSALQIQEETLAQGEADALRIRSNTESQVKSLRTQGSFAKKQGKAAYQSGINYATGTILSGAANIMSTGIADKWFKPNSAANMIQGQTGFTGGTPGVISGEEFMTFNP